MIRQGGALSRRCVLRGGIAAVVAGTLPGLAVAQDRYDQQHLLEFSPVGAATLIHVGDLFGQDHPHLMRPSAEKIARTGERHLPEHLTGELLRIRFGVGGRQPMDYALTHAHFEEDAEAYGPMGGLAHVKTIVAAIRARRPGAVVVAGQGAGGLSPLQFRPTLQVVQIQGVAVAMIDVTDRTALADQVRQARAQAAVVVCRSSLGMAANRQVAVDVPGIDLILCQGDAPAFVEPVQVQETSLIASGAQGRFVSRIDLDMRDGTLAGVAHRLIPVFAGVIDPTGLLVATSLDTTALAAAPHTLYRRGALSSTWDNLICAAMRRATGAEIAFVPGLQHGVSVLSGSPITRSAIQSVLWGQPSEAWTARLTGAEVAGILQKAADATFHVDPYQRIASAMMRAQGISFGVDPDAAEGAKVTGIRLQDGSPLDPAALYEVVGWGDVFAGTLAGPVEQMVEAHLTDGNTRRP